MDVLVAYATRHGATRGIAERIATILEERGLTVTLRDVEHAGDIADYDAFVVGSAIYLGSWRKEAVEFVRANRPILRERPTWLFGSGPLRVAAPDAETADPRAATEALELADSRDAAALDEAVHPRGHRVFFGVLDPATLGVAERLMRALPAGRELLPEGDFRDWDEIEAWAGEIAIELSPVAVG